MASSRILPTAYTEHTYDSAGGGEDYTSLATWESDTDTDLVTGASGYVLTCTSGVHNDTLYMGGATTNASYFRVIRAASGARGTPTSGVRFEYSSAGAVDGVVRIGEEYSRAHDIAAKATSTGNYAMCLGWNAANTYFVGCTAYGADSPSSSYATIGFNSPQINGNIFMIDCVSMNHELSTHSSSANIRIYLATAGLTTTLYAYNCTSVAGYRGILLVRTNGTLVANTKNCIFQGNTTDIVTSGTVTHTQITNATSGVTFDTDGYHLKQGVIGTAVAQGTDLSSDATFPFDDDIDGTTITRAWAIGCDWYAPTANADASGTSRKLPAYYYTSTFGGATRNYTAFTTWEADTDINLTTPTVGFVLDCYDDAASYTDIITMSGATTDANYFRVLRPATGQGHDGTPNNGFTLANTGDTTTSAVVRINEGYSAVHDIIVIYEFNSTANRQGILLDTQYARAIGCIVKTTNTNTGAAYGFKNEHGCFFINCIAYECKSAGYRTAWTSASYYYNCIAVAGADDGFVEGSTGDVFMKNCISQGNAGDAVVGTVTQTTCAVAGGVVFVDVDTDDYHLDSSDTTAIDQGTSLSADAVYAFADDIDGETRSDWDIGADEYVSAGGTTTSLFDCKISIKDSTTVLLDSKTKVTETDTDLLDILTSIKDSETDLLDAKIKISDAIINLLDGKAVVKDSGTELLDAKILIKDGAYNLLDVKVQIKDSAINVADGKVVIGDTTVELLDAKINLKDSVVDLLDGKAVIKDAQVDVFDALVRIKDSATDLLDEKVSVTDVAVNQLDAKVKIQDFSIDLLDGKAIVAGAFDSTDQLDLKAKIVDAASNFLDGKILIRDSGENLLDGKITIGTVGVDALDGKIKVQSSEISLIDGKVVVRDVGTHNLDCKILVEDAEINLLDGKAVVKDSASSLLDANVKLKDSAASVLDLLAILKNNESDLFDAKVGVKDSALAFLDLRARLKSVATGQLDLKTVVSKEGFSATDLLDIKVDVEDLGIDKLDGLIYIYSVKKLAYVRVGKYGISAEVGKYGISAEVGKYGISAEVG